MPKLVAKTPSVIDAVYPNYWMTNMNIVANNPNGKVSIRCTLVPSRTLENGTVELNKQVQPVNLYIPDVFAKIQQNPNGPLASAYVAILNALVSEVSAINSLE